MMLYLHRKHVAGPEQKPVSGRIRYPASVMLQKVIPEMPYVLFILFPLIGIFLSIPATAAADMVVQPARKTVLLTGYTRSDTTVTVSSEVSGQVLRVNYDVGQPVGEEPFFEIDPTFIDFQIEGIRQSIRKVSSALEKNASRVTYLQKEFSRYDRLFRIDGATEVQRDQAREELNQTRLEADTLAAEKAALTATLNELQERKRRHRIFAPEGWIVIERMVDPGEIVTVNTPLARIGDYRTLTVPLSVSGEELAAIRSLPAVFPAQIEGEPVNARLDWVNPEFNEKTRKLGLELVLVDYTGERRGGLRFTLPLEIRSAGVRVPRAAVVNRYENPRVTLTSTGETISVMVLGESDGDITLAEDPRLPVGTELSAP